MRANFFWFVKVLIALDFPEFDRPAKATSIPASGGQSSMRGAPQRNLALCNSEAIEGITDSKLIDECSAAVQFDGVE